MQAFAASGDVIGVGYFSKADETNLYADSKGTDILQVVNKDFPLIAYDNRATLFNRKIQTAQSLSNRRLQVFYFKNGKDALDGHDTAWINGKEVYKFEFDCCGDEICSGIETGVFEPTTFTECFSRSIAAAKGAEATSLSDVTAKKSQDTPPADKPAIN